MLTLAAHVEPEASARRRHDAPSFLFVVTLYKLYDTFYNFFIVVEQTPWMDHAARSTGLLYRLYTTAHLGFRLHQARGVPSLGARAAPQLQCRMGEVFTRQTWTLLE